MGRRTFRRRCARSCAQAYPCLRRWASRRRPRCGMAFRTARRRNSGAQVSADMTKKLVEEAKRLEDAGASLIDFTNSGPIAGAAVAAAVSIPVVGGFGGGPWLDGRMRMAHAAIGYAASNVDIADGELRQRREDRVRRDQRVRRGRARGATNQGRGAEGLRRRAATSISARACARAEGAGRDPRVRLPRRRTQSGVRNATISG